MVAVVATLCCVGIALGLRTSGASPADPSAVSRATTDTAPRGAQTRVTPAPPLSMPRSEPVRLRIPAIGVSSTLMHLGLNRDGSLETPPGAFPAGWFTGSPTPGEIGPAIIAGHVRYVSPGVFAGLADLRPRDEVFVRRKDGSTATFRVTRLWAVSKAHFPTQAVYGDIRYAGLRLITCAGLDTDSNVFEQNVVVFARLVHS